MAYQQKIAAVADEFLQQKGHPPPPCSQARLQDRNGDSSGVRIFGYTLGRNAFPVGKAHPPLRNFNIEKLSYVWLASSVPVRYVWKI